ncbi:hypothetical protein BCM14_2270 [Jezberella montanilacus]|jgi:peptidoglycan hydrolase CwlO-like protein|uniref:Uncharacterized protein n=1 Tax=Jezberella montanilacus TaxID=323426 RepID=A0A2T0XE32_9BURK|nr:hypothetical protein [Jezberella montanilacus]PRY97130.1 hypothetical protein BCM14_2270 [Jezberella montanilacus]
MENRVTALEVIAEQTQKSIDRLDRSVERLEQSIGETRKEMIQRIDDLRVDMDRNMQGLRSGVDHKFHWMIGGQFATLLAVIACMATLMVK